MSWTEEEIKFLEKLDDPDKIQAFLDSIDYNPAYECRSPRWVIRKKSAHCFEGALFAAAALNFIGYKPLIIDMKSFNDDDHVIAVFRVDDHWGAIAKSRHSESGETGLGLAIVKALVEIHEGKVWAESTPGAGMTIFMEFPQSVNIK